MTKAQFGRSLAIVLAGMCCFAGRGWTQTLDRISCQASPFRIDGDASCGRFEGAVGNSNTGSVVASSYLLQSRRGELSFIALYMPPPPRQPGHSPNWRAYSIPESERIIRRNAGQEASQFGTYRGFRDTGLIEYRKAQAQCVGFDHGGGPQGDGYEFFIRGEICSSAAIGDPERLVRELLGALRLHAGAAQPMNAFGATPVALAWGGPTPPTDVAPAAGGTGTKAP